MFVYTIQLDKTKLNTIKSNLTPALTPCYSVQYAQRFASYRPCYKLNKITRARFFLTATRPIIADVLWTVAGTGGDRLWWSCQVSNYSSCAPTDRETQTSRAEQSCQNTRWVTPNKYPPWINYHEQYLRYCISLMNRHSAVVAAHIILSKMLLTGSVTIQISSPD